jgi:hypothetical protein
VTERHHLGSGVSGATRADGRRAIVVATLALTLVVGGVLVTAAPVASAASVRSSRTAASKAKVGKDQAAQVAAAKALFSAFETQSAGTCADSSGAYGGCATPELASAMTAFETKQRAQATCRCQNFVPATYAISSSVPAELAGRKGVGVVDVRLAFTPPYVVSVVVSREPDGKWIASDTYCAVRDGDPDPYANRMTGPNPQPCSGTAAPATVATTTTVGGKSRGASRAGLLGETGQLFGVATTRGGGAWAVGYSGVLPDAGALTLHWNGTHWRSEPNPGPAGSELHGVSATGPANVWAVGSSGGAPSSNTLILHWNGTRWRQMPSTAGTLSGVTAISPTNAWAVGTTNNGDTLILHWNGRTWQQTSSPSVGTDQGLASFLDGVAFSSGHVVWAVGSGDNCGCGPGKSLIERWNGKRWSQVRTSTLSGNMNLSGVASLASGRAWAVGQRGGGISPTSSVVARWNGSRWVLVPIPRLGGSHGGLFAVTATSRSDAWAVGWETDGSRTVAGGPDTANPDILILHWNGSAWIPLTKVGFAPPTTTTVPPTTTVPSTPGAAAPLLGSAAWGQALGSSAGITGFGEVAPADISMGAVASSPHVDSISWSNWGAPEATGQGQAIDGTGQTGPVSSWPVKPVTVVAFDLGNCGGGPPAYQKVTWYFPEDGQTFDPSAATNACTG